MRPPARTGLFLTLALTVSACVISVDYSSSRLRCSDGVCPPDFACVDGVCVAEGSALDAIDASPEPDGPVDAQSLASCDTVFGTAPGFLLCEELAATCAFSAQTNQGTCRQVCDELGRSCVTAFDNAESALCEKRAEESCDMPRSTEICVCERGATP